MRVGILGALILLCIGQTITLWLGSMSSHHFFAGTEEESYAQYYVFPKEMWANISGYAYKIEGANREESTRDRLIAELSNELKRTNVKVTKNTEMDYTTLLSMRGIVYQYGMPITLSELAGKSVMEGEKGWQEKIQDIFIDVSANDSYSVYAYLIGEDGQVKYKVTFNSQMNSHYETLKYFDAKEFKEEVEDRKLYQASLLSANDSERFKGNVFYPVNNKQMPLLYEQLSFQPMVLAGDEEGLESRVNGLFKNPIYKQKIETETEVIFNDNLNLSVRYNKMGTLSFKKSMTETGGNLNPVERLDKILAFIEETKAISPVLKEGLYLKKTVRDPVTGYETYYFGYQYENNDVLLTERIQTQLGIKAYVELTMDHSELVSGKWLMLEPFVFNSTLNTLSTEFYEAVSLFSEVEGEKGEKLSDMACVYVLDSLDSVAAFKWVAFDEAGQRLMPKQPKVKDRKN